MKYTRPEWSAGVVMRMTWSSSPTIFASTRKPCPGVGYPDVQVAQVKGVLAEVSRTVIVPATPPSRQLSALIRKLALPTTKIPSFSNTIFDGYPHL